jgi:hypothetical protein
MKWLFDRNLHSFAGGRFFLLAERFDEELVGDFSRLLIAEQKGLKSASCSPNESLNRQVLPFNSPVHNLSPISHQLPKLACSTALNLG